jgi:hypothetical protein
MDIFYFRELFCFLFLFIISISFLVWNRSNNLLVDQLHAHALKSSDVNIFRKGVSLRYNYPEMIYHSLYRLNEKQSRTEPQKNITSDYVKSFLRSICYYKYKKRKEKFRPLVSVSIGNFLTELTLLRQTENASRLN